MDHRMAVVYALLAMGVWSASAEAQELDRKATNGAACVPVVGSSGAPSSSTMVSFAGGRFSTQGGTSETRPPIVFVCPLVRDDLDGPFPVTVSVVVNARNYLPFPGEDFACNLKVVDRKGGVVSESGDVLIKLGTASTELNAGEVSLSTDDVYVMVCTVPNLTLTPSSPDYKRSGIISYKWTEESL